MQTDETRDRQAALERLMAQYGTALLRYYQGMKVNDVAQALRRTRSGVKHRLKQANKLLRTQLEGRYDGEISRIVDAGSQDIAQDRAEELGKVALLEDFGLTKEGFEAEGSELVYATLYQRPNGQRIWDLDWYIPAYVNGIEWSCCVRLDAQTGEILDCDAVTGGIG